MTPTSPPSRAIRGDAQPGRWSLLTQVGLGALLATLMTACASHAPPQPPQRTSAAPRYPATPALDVVEDYHGTPVPDPYRWLEALDSPQVRAWAAAQDSVTSSYVAGDPLRARLLARIAVLARPWEDLPPAAPQAARGTRSFGFAPAPRGSGRVVTVGSPDSAPRTLIDPREFGSTVDVARFDVSPDEQYVAYALSDAGSEWWQVRIRRTADGRDLPEVLDDMLWAAPVWTHGGTGFFYVRYGRPAPGERAMFRSPAVRYHQLGTPPSEDVVVFATPEGSTTLDVGVQLTPDGRYALLDEGEGAHVDGLGWLRTRRWLLDLRDPRQPDLTSPLVPVTPDRTSAYELVGQRDSLLYFFTDRAAPRGRLVAVPVRDPSLDRASVVIPQHDDVLTGIREVHGRWVATYLGNVQHRVRVHEFDGRLLRELDIPPLSGVDEVRPGPGAADVDVVTSSFVRPPALTRHDLATGRADVVHAATAPFDTAAFEARQVWYASKDGTQVPMFVVHRRGIVLDGSNPTLLYGYGASGQSMSPEYPPHFVAWLERGGVFAAPALRGGGEFGREWYEAATLARKQTSFDDFIAAAEWLIAEGYTSPARLAIRGVSNGGLLVSAVLAQRPELFAAAVAEVPKLDVLRVDYGRHRAQFGWAGDPAQFPFLLGYAPLQRIRAGTCYPATLITTALNDDRAPAWEAMKLAATLQAAQGCARPVLLRVHGGGGHFGSRGSWAEREAEILAFLASRLGVL